MTSTLLRLFRLAKATSAQALENYTTEALAAAVRADPGPFLVALRARDIVTADGVEIVQTQVHIAGNRGHRSGRPPCPAGWQLIGAHKRLAEFADHAEQTAWLVEQLDDLKQAGLLTLLPTLGSGEPAPAEGALE